LRAGGILSIGCFDLHPDKGLPRHALRFVAEAYPVLRERGVERPADHIMVVSEGNPMIGHISFVQRFILFLGYPTYSLTVTLFSLLTSAGIGSWLSDRLPEDPRHTLPRLTKALTALVDLYLVALSRVFDTFLAAPFALRVAISVTTIAPFGILLGMYFPYGIRLTSRLSRDFVAWAWAVNGCLTVVGSVASFTHTWARVGALPTRT